MLKAAVITVVIYMLVQSAKYAKERAKSPFNYFNWSEFDSPDAPGSGKLEMNEGFVHTLDQVRACAGFPFVITSGYRTPAHNSRVGGVANSSHLKGIAVDIAAPTESMKRKIAECAIRNGITRIGWGRSFIHLDIDQDKSQHVVWNYGNSAPSYNELAQNLA